MATLQEIREQLADLPERLAMALENRYGSGSSAGQGTPARGPGGRFRRQGEVSGPMESAEQVAGALGRFLPIFGQLAGMMRSVRQLEDGIGGLIGGWRSAYPDRGTPAPAGAPLPATQSPPATIPPVPLPGVSQPVSIPAPSLPVPQPVSVPAPSLPVSQTPQPAGPMPLPTLPPLPSVLPPDLRPNQDLDDIFSQPLLSAWPSRTVPQDLRPNTDLDAVFGSEPDLDEAQNPLAGSVATSEVTAALNKLIDEIRNLSATIEKENQDEAGDAASLGERNLGEVSERPSAGDRPSNMDLYPPTKRGQDESDSIPGEPGIPPGGFNPNAAAPGEEAGEGGGGDAMGLVFGLLRMLGS